MSEQATTTVNGFEIEHPRDPLTFDEFQQMAEDYGITGDDPRERLRSLQKLSAQELAIFLTDLNRRLQGSEGTLINENTSRIGGKSTITPEDRYNIFSSVVEQIQMLPSDTNPARVGDTVALTTVLLHPFKDGNGRTARTVGFLFRDNYDEEDASDVFVQVTASREKIRETGGAVMISYTPKLSDEDRSDPKAVRQYLDTMLSEEYPRYVAIGYDYAPLKVPKQ